jgi:hypothetical protein
MLYPSLGETWHVDLNFRVQGLKEFEVGMCSIVILRRSNNSCDHSILLPESHISCCLWCGHGQMHRQISGLFGLRGKDPVHELQTFPTSCKEPKGFDTPILVTK